jgi:hypothetical protein
MPFDHVWFAALLAEPARPPERVPEAEWSPATSAALPETTPTGPRRQDWGEMPGIAGFHGRADELATLRRWVVADRCRVVALLGLGGIGKTMLAARLARDVAPQFDRVYWRSLHNAPPPSEWLAGAIGFVSNQQTLPPEGEAAQLRLLLELLRQRRCLLVLDNLETVIQPGKREGRYRAGYEGYGTLLQLLEAAEALRRRSLLEPGTGGATLTLQPVVLEYVTGRLVEDVAREIATHQPVLLLGQALVKATAKDYVRRSQERLIAAPVLEQLIAEYGSERGIERRLTALLGALRGRSRVEQGYGPGNLVNLLRLLRRDLRWVDLSGLAIRQAYLQEVEAQDASLAGAHLVESVLAEAFDYPIPVALSADGAYLAAGTSGGEVRLWRVADRAPILSVPGHSGGVWAVALSPDGWLLASGGLDGAVGLWEVSSGAALRTLRGDRCYERLDITGLSGLTEAQRGAMVALGAVERADSRH